jgi:predicted transcriptional regulator
MCCANPTRSKSVSPCEAGKRQIQEQAGHRPGLSFWGKVDFSQVAATMGCIAPYRVTMRAVSMSTVQLSVRMAPEIKARLENEARIEDRSASYIIQKALDQYLSAKEYRRQAIEEAAAEADKGIFISDEAMTAWVSSWGTDNELPPPEPDILPDK